MNTHSCFFAKFFTALLFVATPAFSATDLPAGLPAGYETWEHQEEFCVVMKNDGEKGKYRLDLYKRQLPETRQFNGIAIHRLNGEPYFVSHFSARPAGIGYLRHEERLFVRMAKENRWMKHKVFPDTASGARESALSSIDRDYLSVRGTSRDAIKECLRAQSRSQGR